MEGNPIIIIIVPVIIITSKVLYKLIKRLFDKGLFKKKGKK